MKKLRHEYDNYLVQVVDDNIYYGISTCNGLEAVWWYVKSRIKYPKKTVRFEHKYYY